MPVLQNKQAIVRPLGESASIQINQWSHCLIPTPAKGEQAEELTITDLPAGDISVPLAFWLENKADLLAREGAVAVQLAAADFAENVADDLADIAAVVLPFETYVDGRSYSHAYLLRTRFNYTGEIRAVGDVHHDHLNFLARCGVDAFELPEGENLDVACQAFESFSEIYQPSADGGNLIFARRRVAH